MNLYLKYKIKCFFHEGIIKLAMAFLVTLGLLFFVLKVLILLKILNMDIW